MKTLRQIQLDFTELAEAAAEPEKVVGYQCTDCGSEDVIVVGGEKLCAKCGQDAKKKEAVKPAVKESVKPAIKSELVIESEGADNAEITRLELDEIADMADDLYANLPNFNECPAWVGHKVAAMHASMQSVYDYFRLKNVQAQTLGNEVVIPINVNPAGNPGNPLPPVLPAPVAVN